jgi:hypothetical protein
MQAGHGVGLGQSEEQPSVDIADADLLTIRSSTGAAPIEVRAPPVRGHRRRRRQRDRQTRGAPARTDVEAE